MYYWKPTSDSVITSTFFSQFRNLMKRKSWIIVFAFPLACVFSDILEFPISVPFNHFVAILLVFLHLRMFLFSHHF